MNTHLEMINITDKEFDKIRKFVHSVFGINLTEQKKSLVFGRLQKIIKKHGYKSFDTYFDAVKNDKNGSLVSEFINKITTNHTYFNREKSHFDFYYETALPDVVNNLKIRKSKDLRVWCAASSTGEEPYMLLMLLLEFLGHDADKWDAGLLATDISLDVLNFAIEGIYSEERIAQVPKKFLHKYFKKLPNGSYQVLDQYRKKVLFKRLNLMNPFPFKAPFDIIFARNVMIYFDQPTREKLVQKFYNFLKPGGYLFIGHSETLNKTKANFVSIRPAVYRKI